MLSGSHPKHAVLKKAAAAAERTDAVPRRQHVHIVIAADQRCPSGLLAVINSTLRHNTRSRLFFYIIAPPGVHKKLGSFQRTFPAANFSMVSLMRKGISRRIRTRLEVRAVVAKKSKPPSTSRSEC
jgi:hypothetical protein